MSKRIIVPHRRLGLLPAKQVSVASPMYIYAQGDKPKRAGMEARHGVARSGSRRSRVQQRQRDKKFGIEVFRDENNGNWIYICENGSIAVVPGKVRWWQRDRLHRTKGLIGQINNFICPMDRPICPMSPIPASNGKSTPNQNCVGVFAFNVFGHIEPQRRPLHETEPRHVEPQPAADGLGDRPRRMRVDERVTHVVERRPVNIPQTDNVIDHIEVQVRRQRHTPFEVADPHGAALALRQVEAAK